MEGAPPLDRRPKAPLGVPFFSSRNFSFLADICDFSKSKITSYPKNTVQLAVLEVFLWPAQFYLSHDTLGVAEEHYTSSISRIVLQ